MTGRQKCFLPSTSTHQPFRSTVHKDHVYLSFEPFKKRWTSHYLILGIKSVITRRRDDNGAPSGCTKPVVDRDLFRGCWLTATREGVCVGGRRTEGHWTLAGVLRYCGRQKHVLRHTITSPYYYVLREILLNI